MIEVTVGNNVGREKVIVSGDATPRQILETQGIDYARGGVTLDGSTLQTGMLDTSLSQLGISEKCFLLQVVKADNAF